MSQLIQSPLNITGDVTAPNFIGTASWAITASYALNGGSGGITDVSAYLSSSWTGSATSQFAGTASYALNALSASYAAVAGAVSSSVYFKEIHVSSGSGDDTTGTGTLLNPYKTVTKAFSVVGGTGEAIIIHPGVYYESPTLTSPNVTVTSVNTGGGITLISGSVNINVATSSTRINGVRISTLTHSNAGQLYLLNCQIPTQFTKTATGYTEIIDCDTQTTNGLSFTSAAQTVIQGGKQGIITINNNSAIVTIKDSFAAVAPTVTAGTLAIFDSVVYSVASGSAAVTSSPLTVVQLQNSYFVNPSGNPEKLNLLGFVGYDNIVFNKPASSLGGGLSTTAYFQNLDSTLLTATGSIFGTATSASYVNITGSGISVNYGVNGVISLTGSGGGAESQTFQDVTTLGNTTTSSLYIYSTSPFDNVLTSSMDSARFYVGGLASTDPIQGALEFDMDSQNLTWYTEHTGNAEASFNYSNTSLTTRIADLSSPVGDQVYTENTTTTFSLLQSDNTNDINTQILGTRDNLILSSSAVIIDTMAATGSLLGTASYASNGIQTDWTPYSASITYAGGGGPTLATNYTMSAYYRVIGKSMDIMWQYNQPSNAGVVVNPVAYTYPIPPGYQIDLNIMQPTQLNSQANIRFTLGSGQYYNSNSTTNTTPANLAAWDSGSLMLWTTLGQANAVGNGGQVLNVTGQTALRFNVTIPIL